QSRALIIGPAVLEISVRESYRERVDDETGPLSGLGRHASAQFACHQAVVSPQAFDQTRTGCRWRLRGCACCRTTTHRESDRYIEGGEPGRSPFSSLLNGERFRPFSSTWERLAVTSRSPEASTMPVR